MKRTVYFTGSVLAVMFLLLVSCEDKDEGPDPLVGTYVFTSAEFNDSVTIIIQGFPVVFPPGSSAADFVGPGLLAAAPCANPESASIELKEDGTMYYTCLDEETETQMGTWDVNSARTELTLNISVPQAFSLVASDLVITETSFSGTVANFPLPVDTGLDLGAPLPGGLPNIQITSVDATFTKVL